MRTRVLALILQFGFITFALGVFLTIVSAAQAQGPVDTCSGGVLFTDAFGKTYCISQPDSFKSATRQTNAPLASTPPITTAPTPVICDGDGSSGYRVQVIYAYISTRASRFATYRTSLQQWAYDADKEFFDSAAATGGVRHVRYVTENVRGSCYPLVLEVALSPTALQGTGAQRFSQMISEIQRLGYRSQSRDYMVFVDAQQSPNNICGIATMQMDDSANQSNKNNSGPNYMEIDDNCWNGVMAAHELGHNLGSVQLSAPNSDWNTHCIDGFDNMCDHGGSPAWTYTACPDPIGDHLMDCNHDDYFHTNPAPNSYLATHWNTANNRFLVYGDQPSIRIDSIASGKMVGAVFSSTNTFNRNETAVLRVHVVDTNGVNISGASVSFSINQPNGTVQCNFTNQLTDSNGFVQGSCLIPYNAPSGSWHGMVASFTRVPTLAATADSITQHSFTVNPSAPTAVRLSTLAAYTENPLVANWNLSVLVCVIIVAGLVTLSIYKLRMALQKI